MDIDQNIGGQGLTRFEENGLRRLSRLKLKININNRSIKTWKFETVNFPNGRDQGSNYVYVRYYVQILLLLFFRCFILKLNEKLKIFSKLSYAFHKFFNFEN